jgi:hypothetical protein
MLRSATAALMWLVLGSPSPPGLSADRVTATAVAMDQRDPAHDRAGRLHYLGGWVLSSAQPRFGGYSALHVDGDRFLALADTGEWLRFRMARPGAIDRVEFGRLSDYPGRTGAKGDRDSESMTVDRASGDIWVGFEQYPSIFHFAPDFAALKGKVFPPAMKHWPDNEGAESLARLSDGRFVTISEGPAFKNGLSEGLIFPADPTESAAPPISFGYRPPESYVPTDAQQLPDGRLVVLNRHFALMDGMWAAVTIIDPRGVRGGELLEGELIGELRPPLTVDNMEGLSVTREGGRTVLWLISDDNQNGIQRTLLLKFAIEDKPAQKR